MQLDRYQSLGIRTNSQLPNRWIDEYCPFDEEAKALLNQAAEKMNISARTYHKIIRLGRTIADLSGEKIISKAAISEALQYRRVV
jgi:magnesium chelatase family protein